jgi:hypothetical protein
MNRYVIILIFAMMSICITSPVRADVDVSVNFSFSELNDYGEWVHIGGYGKAWRPYADHGWRPFYYGRWEWTNDGWMWDSDEPFGWIVCHYGNWYFDDDFGWVWIPGYEWAPARVEWHVTNDEIGWMPLFPPPLPGRVRMNAGSHWVFCPAPFFASVDVRSHVVVRPRPQSIAHVTVYSGAPRYEVIRKVSRSPVVLVKTNRVTVRSNQRSFVRVQSSARRERVVVPVGPQYKRVTVRSNDDGQRSNVTVTKDRGAEVNQAEPSRSRTEVRSYPQQGSAKVRVSGDSGPQREDEKSTGTRKKKVTVTKNRN